MFEKVLPVFSKFCILQVFDSKKRIASILRIQEAFHGNQVLVIIGA